MDENSKKITEQLRVICTSHFIRERQNKLGTLLNLKKSGFSPSLVFDVGAQIGTPELYTAFPDAHHIFIEPVAECIPTLNEISKQLKSCTVLNCAVSNVNQTKRLSVSQSKQYSSIDAQMGEESRDIEVRTIDSIYENYTPVESILLKIDVDGVELDVLKGSKSVFDNECVIIIEASMAERNPRFQKIVEYLASYDFKVIDIVDPLYRPSDWHLWQVDLVFAKNNSKLWVNHNFA
jgi:FkbM family methyltransferase